MVDRIILDFENNTITWDTENQKGTEICPGLKERKEPILAAMGYEMADFSPIKAAFEAFMNGEINLAELEEKLDQL